MTIPTTNSGLVRRRGAWVAGAMSTVATFVLLFHQFQGEQAPRWTIVGLPMMVMIWWVLLPWPPVPPRPVSIRTANAGSTPTSRSGTVLAITDVAWITTGIGLAVALYRLGSLQPWSYVFDLWLTLLGALTVGAALLARYGRCVLARYAEISSGHGRGGDRDTGHEQGRLFPRGIWHYLGSRGALIGSFGVAPILGEFAAVLGYWVPVRGTDLLRGWWTDWVALPMAVIVWCLWVWIFCKVTGIWQTLHLSRRRGVRRRVYREPLTISERQGGEVHMRRTSWVNEQIAWEEETTGPVPLLYTGARPLVWFKLERVVERAFEPPKDDLTESYIEFAHLKRTVIEFPPSIVPFWLRLLQAPGPPPIY